MASLVVLKDGHALVRFPLDREQISVGRGQQVDLYLADGRVSRLHFIIRRESQGYRLIDRSFNGTQLNRQRVKAGRLKDGDLIQAGSCVMRFDADDLEDTVPTAHIQPSGEQLSYHAETGQLHFTRPWLTVTGPDGRSHRHRLRGEVISVGSDASHAIQLPVGPAHLLTVVATPEGFQVTTPAGPALLSEGQPLPEESPVPLGQVLRIGAFQAILEVEQGTEAVTPICSSPFEGMVGQHPTMQRLFGLIERFSRLDAPVLVLGESGTGKELVARALHQRGHRSRGPFVAVNCSAISPQLFESELFGHEKGAFTGAVKDRLGAFEAANGGTLFLDELGDLPLELQPKLLRALETGTITPVGSYQSKAVNVRVVAATHRDLSQMVIDGTFRADLFFRLFVLSLELPALKHRPEDLPTLIQFFLDQLQGGPQRPTLSPEAMQRLLQHSWPGNIRELRHTLTRALASSTSGHITADDLQFISTLSKQITPSELGPQPVLRLEELEREAITNALRVFDGNRKEAARALGIARSTLHMRVKVYGLDSVNPGH